MEAIKKQATKLREQVAKQQQTVLRHLQNLGDRPLLDDVEMQCHHHLQTLYNCTRSAKHFQRDIVYSVDGFISISKKQMEITRKFAEDCQNYGSQDQSLSSPLARASMHFGTSHSAMEDEREIMLRILCDQVSAPLRASVAGAPLEDARRLTHHYDKISQEVEAQAAEVIRCQSRCRDPSEESLKKLKNAEARLTELRFSMVVLGREATSAMLSVEDQQKQIIFQKILTVVDAERSYHRKLVAMLEKLRDEMALEKQLCESSAQKMIMQCDLHFPPAHVDASSDGSDGLVDDKTYGMCFIAKVIHSFDAQTESELSLAVDDYVVVRQVAQTGWSEGECKGKAGWFPSAYIEKQETTPARKII